MDEELISRIAEQRIEEAMREGAFDDLPGKGKPLRFEDDSFVPEDRRLAYKMLRNAGMIPPELELKKEITTLMDFIGALDDDAERTKKIRELNLKLTRFSIMMKRPLNVEQTEYEGLIYKRLTSGS